PIDPIWGQVSGIVGLPEFRLGGSGSILAKLAMGANQWLIEGINADINDFTITGPATNIYEKKLRVEGGALVDWAGNQFSSKQFTVVGTTVSARANDVVVPLANGGTAAGQLAYRVDLSRGIHWVLPPEWLGQNRVAGELAGTMNLSSDANGVVLQNGGQIANWEFVVPQTNGQPGTQPRMQPASSGQPALAWREANLAYSQQLSLNRAEDTLAIHECTLQGSALKLAASGGVSQLSTAGNVSIQGQRKSRFQWTGPLWGGGNPNGPELNISPAWEAAGDVSWQQASLYGIPAGETTLSAQLRQGIIQLTANSPELSGGQLSLNSQLLLNAKPMQWQIPQGRVIDN
ncbi:unnamed protein product, partial [Symbiodinium sp. CCMP2456]